MEQAGNSTSTTSTNGSSSRWAFVFLFVLIVVDQLSKSFIFISQASLVPLKGVGIVPFKNFHFAFSLPVPTAVTFVIYFMVLTAAFWHVAKKYRGFSKQETVAWVLIFAGAFSNVGERIALGYVRDFIYIFSGIFNLADGYILVGLVLLLFNQDKNNKSQMPSIK